MRKMEKSPWEIEIPANVSWGRGRSRKALAMPTFARIVGIANAVQPLPAKGFKAADISARYEEIVNRNGKKGNVG